MPLLLCVPHQWRRSGLSCPGFLPAGGAAFLQNLDTAAPCPRSPGRNRPATRFLPPAYRFPEFAARAPRNPHNARIAPGPRSLSGRFAVHLESSLPFSHRGILLRNWPKPLRRGPPIPAFRAAWDSVLVRPRQKRRLHLHARCAGFSPCGRGPRLANQPEATSAFPVRRLPFPVLHVHEKNPQRSRTRPALLIWRLELDRRRFRHTHSCMLLAGKRTLLFLTGGVRLGRARRQWSRSHPFPVSSTASHCRRTKSESQDVFLLASFLLFILFFALRLLFAVGLERRAENENSGLEAKANSPGKSMTCITCCPAGIARQTEELINLCGSPCLRQGILHLAPYHRIKSAPPPCLGSFRFPFTETGISICGYLVIQKRYSF